MCHERWLRRHREADESQNLWQDFERTRPIADPDVPPDTSAPEPTEAQEEFTLPER